MCADPSCISPCCPEAAGTGPLPCEGAYRRNVGAHVPAAPPPERCVGKAPAGVAQLAKACQPDCLTVALCGSATREAARVNSHGIDAYFPILHAPMPLAEAMDRDTTEANLSQTVEQVMRLVHQAVKR